MPRGRKAPKLWPADPVHRTVIVSSGSPSPPHMRVTSEPSMVPTARSTLRTARSKVTARLLTTASRHSSIRLTSNARSSR